MPKTLRGLHMYCCQVCGWTSLPGAPRLINRVYRKDGTIRKEIAVCPACHKSPTATPNTEKPGPAPAAKTDSAKISARCDRCGKDATEGEIVMGSVYCPDHVKEARSRRNYRKAN